MCHYISPTITHNSSLIRFSRANEPQIAILCISIYTQPQDRMYSSFFEWGIGLFCRDIGLFLWRDSASKNQRPQGFCVVLTLGGRIIHIHNVCCSVLQCVAVCCSVLQCVAVCCSACVDFGRVLTLVGRNIHVQYVYIHIHYTYNIMGLGFRCHITGELYI